MIINNQTHLKNLKIRKRRLPAKQPNLLLKILKTSLHKSRSNSNSTYCNYKRKSEIFQFLQNWFHKTLSSVNFVPFLTPQKINWNHTKSFIVQRTPYLCLTEMNKNTCLFSVWILLRVKISSNISNSGGETGKGWKAKKRIKIMSGNLRKIVRILTSK